jgi:hypothetical protein
LPFCRYHICNHQNKYKAENAKDTPLFSRKFLCSLADLALPLVCS